MSGGVPAEKCPGVSEERLSIEVTTQCNSDCPHCFVRPGLSTFPCLSIDEVKSILAEGFDIGYRHLHLTGGEPLLWPSLFEALDFAFTVGYESILLNTNGMLLAENDTCRRLSSFNGLSITVSLEGDEGLHDDLRGKGSYGRTVRGIEQALDEEMEVIIFSVARKSLLPFLPRFVAEVYDRFSGVKDVTLIQLFSNSRDPFLLSEELLEPDELLHLVRVVALLNLFGFLTFVKNNPLVTVLSELLEMPWIPPASPLYRQGSIMVRANRDISLCHSTPYSFGKYQSGLLEDTLVSKPYQKAVAPDFTTCPSCSYLVECVPRGMVRPLEGMWGTHPERLYCKEVLRTVMAQMVPGWN